jgi:hypothetical protein
MVLEGYRDRSLQHGPGLAVPDEGHPGADWVVLPGRRTGTPRAPADTGQRADRKHP